MNYTVLGLAVFVLFFIVTTNSDMVMLRGGLLNAWSRVDIQLKRRYGLIPGLLETVREYAGQTQETLQRVTDALAAAMTAGSVTEQAGAEKELNGALDAMFALAENCPELQDDDGYQNMLKELADTAAQTDDACRLYNDIVKRYNTRLCRFPTNIVAARLGFRRADYFSAD